MQSPLSSLSWFSPSPVNDANSHAEGAVWPADLGSVTELVVKSSVSHLGLKADTVQSSGMLKRSVLGSSKGRAPPETSPPTTGFSHASGELCSSWAGGKEEEQLRLASEVLKLKFTGHI